MDVKSPSASLFSPSGSILLVGLGTILVLAAVLFDWQVGQNLGNSDFLANFPMTVSLVITSVMAAMAGFIAVPWLQKIKAGQFIREDGPKAHLKKAGTPTMGGIFFVPVGVIVALLLSKFAPQVMAASLMTLAYAGIGWVDDWQILQKKSNQGISPRGKLLLQIAIAIAFCFWLYYTQPGSITNVNLPFGIILGLGIFFWPLAGFVLAAESNATNLTDGVDGLAAGTGAIALLGLGAVAAPQFPELMVFCACMSGSYLGFLLHNRNPAQVFMGDTGSLALGGALGAVGLISSNLWPLFILSGIFFVESLSVIAQVSYYKATKGPDGIGKRLFKMAPIHHHLELSGWTETQVVGVFYLINALLALLGYFGN
ncbi:phospho-N-acetylmuramoyl-pentapeptide-transferase [Merismopedia glauca]|uniref:Phospho-N-acetylmuramoyl-pentapeptide-transferase n=1 Tax=Merismopedia glauca CCAP 1448/3 TaxID=1296344 RepID=A0A2T1C0Y7_9CYAN|nr:phospho-N-acetylmuramoyl-pentapeptide-transferase [Merismopedia glauca]PSB01936.1 phospho-N-acetylmuramoyl-pentapeptide-transferase [Merismopedia glauca CCAP 1448/3]